MFTTRDNGATRVVINCDVFVCVAVFAADAANAMSKKQEALETLNTSSYTNMFKNVSKRLS